MTSAETDTSDRPLVRNGASSGRRPAPRLTVVGAANLDRFIRVPRLPEPGETMRATAPMESGGGKGANQAVAARRLGVDVVFVGAVGRDPAGARLEAALEREGIDTRFMQRVAGVPTGEAWIAVDGQGGNLLFYIPGANDALDVDAIPDAALAAGDAVLLQNELAEAAPRLARRARAHARRVIWNAAPVDRWDPAMIALTDILVANHIEVVALVPGTSGPIAAATRLLDMGVGEAVIVTRGGAGAELVTREASWHVDAVAAGRVVDTTGCGDAFAAAAAVGLVRGLGLPAAMDLAARVAGLAATRPGAQPSFPRAEELAGERDPGA